MRPTHQDRHSPLTSSHRPPLGAQPSHGARPARGQAGHEPPPPPAAPAALAAGPARPGLCPVRAGPSCSEEPVRRGADRKEARQEGELPLRVCARVCVPRVCVCVCACACL